MPKALSNAPTTRDHSVQEDDGGSASHAYCQIVPAITPDLESPGPQLVSQIIQITGREVFAFVNDRVGFPAIRVHLSYDFGVVALDINYQYIDAGQM